MDIVGYLESKGCEVRPGSKNNIHTHCFFCGEEKSKAGRLYVSVDENAEPKGLFLCFLCGQKGTFSQILAHFGDTDQKISGVDEEGLPDALFCKILQTAADYYHELLMETPDAYRYLIHDRGFSDATIRKFRFGWADGSVVTHLINQGFHVEDIGATGLVDKFGGDFFDQSIIIPYVRFGQTVSLRAKIIGGKYRSLPGHTAALFNADSLFSFENPPPPPRRAETDNQPCEDSTSSSAIVEAEEEGEEGGEGETGLMEVADALPESDMTSSSHKVSYRLDPAQFVCVCEGEFDVASLDQLGFRAVGVPGVSVWKDSWTDLVQEFRRVYICFDNDTAGHSGAEKLSTRLGPVSRVVNLPDIPGASVDINFLFSERNYSTEDFLHLFLKAKGGILVSVHEAYDRWLEIEGNPDRQGLRFNIETLDSQMRHGLMPAQVITMISKTNGGKTLTLINMFHRMSMVKPDIKILFVSLEQTRNEWFERAHRINTFYNLEASLGDTVNYWSDKLLLVDKNRLTQSELQDCIDQFEFEMGSPPDLVAVDYLGYYARAFKGEEYARVTDAIMGLKQIAKENGLIVFCPSQVNRTGQFGKALSADQAKSSSAVEETSDMMFSIVNPDQDSVVVEPTREVHYKILKSRDGGTGHVAKMQFAPLTLALVPQTDFLFERALRERDFARAGDTYEQALARHRSGLTQIRT